MKYVKPENVNYIINKGDILACKYYHILYPEGSNCIGGTSIEKVDNKKWEIFWVYKETENAYYGSRAEGLGLYDCMILKSDTRPFLEKELEKLNQSVYSLEGAFSGKVSHQSIVKIKPIINQWGKVEK